MTDIDKLRREVDDLRDIIADLANRLEIKTVENVRLRNRVMELERLQDAKRLQDAMTDAEFINWLEQQSKEGACPALICDDNGNWAVSFEGMQNVVKDPPGDVSSTFFVMARDWKPSIREAIREAIDRW